MAFLKGDGTVLSANPALVAMVKRDLWDVVGSALDLFLKPGDRARWGRFFARFRTEPGAADNFESAFFPSDGSERWWTLHLSDLGIEWSGDACYFAVLQDVTVRRAAEQKLREARSQAEGANRAKSEFLANMSHEIRTPLFTITGMTDLIRLGDLSRDQAHHAGQIASAAQHLLDLVNDVLDFSKIEAGQMSLEAIPLDLDEVMGRSLEVVSLSAYRKGLELVLDVDPTVPRRWLGDPSRLRQVLVNLLGNAVKFTAQGRVTLVLEPGPTFRVRDTGIGIKESSRSALFQVFTQADSSTTRQFGGTGLGLAISQKLVGLMGGTIGFTSVYGQGTEFFFTLALGPVAGPPPEVPGAAPGQGRTLLVVDDDPGVRELLVRRLGDAGFAVEAVADRTQAHAFLGRCRPAAVLIDQELGPEDGWQLASEVRAQPGTADLPLVLMSLLRKTLEPSPRYPADLFRAFVDKPVNTRTLVDTLVRGLGGDWAESADTGRVPGLLDRALAAKSTQGLRILVAEDHEVNRELFRLLLRSLGHQPTLVENGQEACEAALATRPQLVFMDLQMPVMNGYQASQELRRRGVKVPIVAVTASALKGELERCRAAGMDGILTKPFNRETLDSVVRSYGPGAETAPDPVPAVEPAAEATLPVFDRDEALRVFLGNGELLDKLVRKFRDQTGPALDRLAEAVQAGDPAAIRSGAHALKGSAANLTARRLAQAAEALEHAAAEGRLESSGALFQAIRRAWTEFEADPGTTAP
jgi:signal transduction histidine kinase/CheY-like chemotaxis protein